ncbi:MAG: hypothetical protein H0V27_04925 [Pyrinomonadaceae bacterium]|nr:hypothetical protein [Pyrinomonadaceae bacterium]
MNALLARGDATKRGRPPGKKIAGGRKLPSRMYKRIKVDESCLYRLPPLDAGSLAGGEGKGGRLQTGVARSLPHDLALSGRWFDLEEGRRARVLGVVSIGAFAVRVRFADVQLAAGEQLFVRSLENTDEVYGPYEGRGLSPDGSFWTPPVVGDGIVIEYFDSEEQTRASANILPFRITEINHMFRD